MSKKRILILGGGAVGAIVANKVSREMRHQIARGELQITVLDKSGTSYNQGGYTFIPFGLLTPGDITRSRRSLISPRVNCYFGPDGEVVKVDLEQRTVETSSGKKHEYDYLLIATGCRCDKDSIPGLRDDFNTFYTDLEDTLNLKEQLENMPKGNVVILTTGMPVPCPGAPGKFATLLDDYVKNVKGWKPGADSKISFLWPLPLVGPPEYNRLFTQNLKQRGIEDRREFKVSSVDPSSRQVVSAEGEKIDYDLLITIPAHKPAQAMAGSGITDDKGWVPADKYSLRYQKGDSKSYREVYVVGDTGPADILKTGIGAHYQAAITAQNLINDLHGVSVTVPYRGETGCPFVQSSYTTSQRGKAHIATWTYDNPLKPFKPTEFGWFFYRMYYYIYWDTAIKGLL